MHQAPRSPEFPGGFRKSAWGSIISFPVFFSVACLILVLVLVLVLIRQPSQHVVALRGICDGAVKMLLTSHDVAEIERSGVLINSLNCDVARRIGVDGAFLATTR